MCWLGSPRSGHLAKQAVVCIRDTDAAGGDLEELLAVPGDRVGQVDDVHDVGPAEAGDLHSTHAGEAMASDALS